VIATVLRISRLNLSRDRVAQLMAFVLPLAFFSIFALVFGQQPRRSPNPVRVALVDEDRSDASRAFVKALEHEAALRPLTTARPRGGPASAASVPLDRPRAESLVKDGDAPAAVVLPAGFGAAFGSAGTPPRAELLVDPRTRSRRRSCAACCRRRRRRRSRRPSRGAGSRCSRSTPAA